MSDGTFQQLPEWPNFLLPHSLAHSMRPIDQTVLNSLDNTFSPPRVLVCSAFSS